MPPMHPLAMIIFGASGDLTRRKLLPALFSLFRNDRLQGDFSILGTARTEFSDESFREYARERLRTFVKPEEQDPARFEE